MIRKFPDIMATCLDVSNANYPTNFNSNNIVTTSGKSLLPLWNNSKNANTFRTYFLGT